MKRVRKFLVKLAGAPKALGIVLRALGRFLQDGTVPDGLTADQVANLNSLRKVMEDVQSAAFVLHDMVVVKHDGKLVVVSTPPGSKLHREVRKRLNDPGGLLTFLEGEPEARMSGKSRRRKLPGATEDGPSE